VLGRHVGERRCDDAEHAGLHSAEQAHPPALEGHHTVGHARRALERGIDARLFKHHRSVPGAVGLFDIQVERLRPIGHQLVELQGRLVAEVAFRVEREQRGQQLAFSPDVAGLRTVLRLGSR
jgi:hypothetical protein